MLAHGYYLGNRDNNSTEFAFWAASSMAELWTFNRQELPVTFRDGRQGCPAACDVGPTDFRAIVHFRLRGAPCYLHGVGCSGVAEKRRSCGQ